MLNNITFRTATSNDADILFEVKIKAFADEFENYGYSIYDNEMKAAMKNAIDEHNADNERIENSFFSHKWHELFCSFGDMLLNGATGWTAVIEDMSKVIGSICVLPANHSGEEYPGVEMTDDINVLVSMYVLPEYQNKGIGKLAIDYMKKLHPSEKWILDTPSISTKNKHFYEKCGFDVGDKLGANGEGQIFTKGI